MNSHSNGISNADIPMNGFAFDPVFLKIRPEDIVRLKSVLEGHEHLGILRTLRKEDGIVALFTLKDTKGDLELLLSHLCHEFPPEARPIMLTLQNLDDLGILPPPQANEPFGKGRGFDGDWDACDWLLEDSLS